MPQYNYTAKNFSGQKVSGFVEADNLQAFYQLLKNRQLFCIEVNERKKGKVIKVLSSSSAQLKTKELAVFSRQFYVLLTSGVTVVKALDVIYQQTTKKKVKEVILKVYEAVQKGDLLSEAMRKQEDAFPEILINMVQSGEASGKLEAVLIKMAEHFEKEHKLRAKIISAMIYPAVLSLVAVIVVTVLVTFVLPTFVSMFAASKAELPLPTKILLSISYFTSNYWYVLLLATVGFVTGIRKYLMSQEGRQRWDWLKLRLPLIGSTSVKVMSARLTRTLSTLLGSGIPLLTSIEITAKVLGNKVVSDNLLAAREDMSKGSTLAQAVNKVGVFPAMVHSMISIGEESGSLEHILEKTSAYFDEEVDTAIQRMLSLFEPLLIVFMAMIVGFIVISIALAMFRAYGTIG